MYYRKNKKTRTGSPSRRKSVTPRDLLKTQLGQLRNKSERGVSAWMEARLPFIYQYISPVIFQQFLRTIKDTGGSKARTRRLFNVVVDMILDAETNRNLDTLQVAIASPERIEIPSGEQPRARQSTPTKAQQHAREAQRLERFLDTRQFIPTLEIIDILNDLPRHYFMHEGVRSSIVNLTPHPMHFYEINDSGEKEIITLGRSGMYLRAVPPRQWSEEGRIKFGRHYVGQNIKFLKQSMRHERNTVYAYLAPVDVPKSRTDYYAYGIFPTPNELASFGEPNTYYIVSALTECVNPIYLNFIMPYKHKEIDGLKVVTAFQLADGICHGLI